ncbi:MULTISPECIES: peptidase [unclassified Streptomyces]|uniref:peptidase n=1 Tax=unclassified Streptomyces TaxID=2593676 RepID=UPI0009BD1624|nr:MULTISPECIES: peptidase [unclassified Streptomyces]MCX4916174.1 peptidase [Streptomyces sp. NBC_00687]OQQ17593.1 peptidase [Streptomyces sp. M41(2017)]
MATEDLALTDSTEAAEAEPLTAQALRTYPLAPGHTVNVRSGPGTHFSIVRTLSAGSRIPIYCQCPGESVTGPYGVSKIWDNISNGQFVSDAYVQTGSDGYVAPKCS